jgi:hypothetical protein
MKIDPGIHIVMHLVFFGKTGVTETVVTTPGRLVYHSRVVDATMLSLILGRERLSFLITLLSSPFTI